MATSTGNIKVETRTITIPLPEGVTVKDEPSVGVGFYDKEDNLIVYHPWDCDAIRRFVWERLAKREKKKKEE